MLYRDACDTKIAWDSPLPSDLQAKWKKREQGLPEHVKAPRNIVKHVRKILSIALHTFEDASGKGVSAAVYVVVEQPSGTNQGLVTAESRLVMKGLTIPRLELLAGHMAANLKEVLRVFP